MLAVREDYFEHTKKAVERFLRKQLKDYNITQHELALKMQGQGYAITLASIHQYCNGNTLIRSDKLAMIADFLGVSTDEILGMYDGVVNDGSK